MSNQKCNHLENPLDSGCGRQLRPIRREMHGASLSFQWHKRWLALLLLSLIYLSGMTIDANAAATASQTYQSSSGTTYYVSKKGNNQDGKSWQSAWNEFDQINWNQIAPGDTVLIDGGANEMTYRTTMDIKKSGANGRPILIQRASESGRDGQIILFGGRADPLPYCFQTQRNYQEDGVTTFGIRTNHHSWIILDGREWRGIVIHGFERSGIRIDQNSKNVTVRHTEIYNNGYARWTSRGWYPDGVGIRLGGENIVVERSIIHDNGQDAIQSLWSPNNIRNFRISQSWLYNGRPHPTVDESANYCTHTDALQIYDGGLISGVTVEESVIGPGFTNNLILGQTRTSNGSKADVHDVTLRHTLFTKSADNGIFGYEDTNTRNWQIENITIHCPKTKWHCIQIDNTGHSVKNSIVYGSRLTFEQGIPSHENNCIWQTQGRDIGQKANPQFVNVSDSDSFSLDDYSLRSGSPCQGKGSKITSVRQLLQLGDSAPIDGAVRPPGQPAPVPTPAPTPAVNPNPITPDPIDPAPFDPSPIDGDPIVPMPTDKCGGLAQEAESGQLVGMFTVGHDAKASGGGYVHVPDYSGNRGLRPDYKQRAEYCVRVDEASIYRLRAWSYGESGWDNSFYVRIDGQPSQAYLWHSPINMNYPGEFVTNYTPAQNHFAPVEAYLEEGIHTVTFLLREDGTRLDKFELVAIGEETNRDSELTNYGSYMDRLVNDISEILENLVDSIYIPMIVK